MTARRLVQLSQSLGSGVALALVALCGPTEAAQAPSAVETQTPVARVRALDGRAAATLREGLARSATFRELASALENSDLVVYVEIGSLRTHSVLSFMAATSGGRVVRISLDFRDTEPFMIEWLGHELRHAVELAAAPNVRDQESLRQLYQRIGEQSSSGGWCTRAAQLAGAAVLDEVLTGSGARQQGRNGC
jgi:hypothetical protein